MRVSGGRKGAGGLGREVEGMPRASLRKADSEAVNFAHLSSSQININLLHQHRANVRLVCAIYYIERLVNI